MAGAQDLKELLDSIGGDITLAVGRIGGDVVLASKIPDVDGTEREYVMGMDPETALSVADSLITKAKEAALVRWHREVTEQQVEQQVEQQAGEQANRVGVEEACSLEPFPQVTGEVTGGQGS